MITVAEAGIADIEVLFEMAVDLWPDYTMEELRTILLDLLASGKTLILIGSSQAVPAGFLYMSIRVDYVEGADAGPTGYLEGIYVKPAYRKTGIARYLLQKGGSWLRRNGCTQIGSNAYETNTGSYDFHKAAGFAEAGRMVAFIKDL